MNIVREIQLNPLNPLGKQCVLFSSLCLLYLQK